MTEETKDSLAFIVLGLILFLVGTSVAHVATDWSWRRQIAGHHCAEFYIDRSNYRQWRWLDCNQKPSSVSVPNDSTTVQP